jgi:glutathione S-transferase
VTRPVLHHYGISSFAEKVRLMLGLKQLGWSGVEIPSTLPKPDLMPLTGGYRKTPVMQIGADIYCDTRRIAEELERRWPEPSIMAGGRGLANVMSAFAEGPSFWTLAVYVMGANADAVPGSFHQDRARMRGAAGADIERIKASVPRHLEQLRPRLAWMADLFRDGRPFVAGDRPGLADFTLYHPLWFIRINGTGVARVLEPHPALTAFMDRVAAIGHGEMREMNAEAALDAAREATPEPAAGVMANAEGWCEGDPVEVTPTDYGREPVAGTLRGYGPEGITLVREDDRVGEVAVHFPRVGFAIRRARALRDAA